MCPFVALQSAAVIIPMMIHNQYYTAKLEGTHVMIWPTHFARDDRSTPIGKDTRCGQPLFICTSTSVSESPYAETALFLWPRARAKKKKRNRHRRRPTCECLRVEFELSRLLRGASVCQLARLRAFRLARFRHVRAQAILIYLGRETSAEIQKRNRSTVLTAGARRRLFRDEVLLAKE